MSTEVWLFGSQEMVGSSDENNITCIMPTSLLQGRNFHPWPVPIIILLVHMAYPCVFEQSMSYPLIIKFDTHMLPDYYYLLSPPPFIYFFVKFGYVSTCLFFPICSSGFMKSFWQKLSALFGLFHEISVYIMCK